MTPSTEIFRFGLAALLPSSAAYEALRASDDSQAA
jgi:hypothetical protein